MRQRRRLAGRTTPPRRAPDSGRPGPGLPAECSGWLVCGHVQDASQPRRRPDPQRRYLLQMHRGSVTRCRCRRPLSLGANQDRSLVSAISRPWAGTSIEFCQCPEWSACHSACHSTWRYSASLERTGWTTDPTRAARTALPSTRWTVRGCLVNSRLGVRAPVPAPARSLTGAGCGTAEATKTGGQHVGQQVGVVTVGV